MRPGAGRSAHQRAECVRPAAGSSVSAAAGVAPPGGKATLRLVVQCDLAARRRGRRAFLQSLNSEQATAASMPPLQSEQHAPEYPQWRELITQATQVIGAGEMDKVVLARVTDLRFSAPLQAFAIMAASRRSNLNCFHFLMAFSPQQAFLGSTPERLWRRRGALLRTEALAGTVANHHDDARAQQLADWLMKDDKTSGKICWWWRISASVCRASRRRLTFCRRRSYACVRCSISGAVSGANWLSRRQPLSAAAAAYRGGGAAAPGGAGVHPPP